ncbi:hypothetical protein COOONC_18862, partial [Cooperia oncophora]
LGYETFPYRISNIHYFQSTFRQSCRHALCFTSPSWITTTCNRTISLEKHFWSWLMFPGFGVAGGNTLRQFNLIAYTTCSNNKEIIDVLASRKEDKEALEFLRSITTAY